MGGPIEELWSEADEAASVRLVRALAAEDLLGALLAIEGASPEREAAVARALDAFAAATRARLALGDDSAAALRAALSVEGGLRGDREGYHDPANSHLSRVLERGLGLPILLSCVWMLVGRRAGLRVEGIGLPGHFIARVGRQLVDPFREGAAIDDEDCRGIVARYVGDRPWDPRWLAPASVRAIVERVLRNLFHFYRDHEQGDAIDLYRVSRLLAAAAPEDPAARLQFARLTEELGADGLAVTLYEAIARDFDGQREARIAAIRVVELGSRTRTLN